MTLDEALDLDQLPAQCGRLAQAFPEAAGNLAQRALVALVDPFQSWDTYPLLRSGSVQLRFYLTRRNNRVVFFFVKQDGREEVVLDAGIRFQIAAVPEVTVPPEPQSQVRFRVEVPSCFVPQASEEERRRLLALAGGDPRDVLFLRFEQGAIAFNTATRSIAWPLSPARVSPKDVGYIWPLLAMVRNLGFWIKDETGAGIEVPLSPAALGGSSDFDRMLRHFAAAREEVLRAIAGGAPSPSSPLDEIRSSLIPAYAATAYQTTLTMRMDETGNMVFEDQEDLFQLAATLDYRDEDGAPGPVLRLKPPDFLLSGPVFDALLDQCETGSASAELSEALAPLIASDAVQSGLSPGATPADAVRGFIQSAREKGSAAHAALVFRIQRGKRSARSPDTDLFVFNGSLGGISQVHLVVKAKVRVHPVTGAAPLSAEILPGEVRLLSCSHLNTGQPLDEMTDYLVRLFRQLKRWYGVSTT